LRRDTANGAKNTMVSGWSQDELDRRPVPDTRPWKLKAVVFFVLATYVYWKFGEGLIRWFR